MAPSTRTSLLFAAIALLQLGTTRLPSSPLVDDSDLSTPVTAVQGSVPLELAPDSIQKEAGPVELKLIRIVKGKPTPVEGLRVVPDCVRGVATASLEAPRFSVTNGNTPYRLEGSVDCTGTTRWIFDEASNAGQAIAIWQIAHTAERKLEEAISLAFWNSPLEFVWPANGDYYNYSTVHITRGDHWDVVSHEMGHAIYDLGRIGGFAGGQHKIDECYNETLALSEGWASFFAGWINLDPNDPDAKFEFMVPRRAPIRFESIPADVCKGPRNEWRVTGFFWDLYDQNADGENSNEAFGRMWKALEGSRSSSTTEAKKRLERSGFDRSLLETIWKLNFLE